MAKMQVQPKTVAADDRNAASETLTQIVELLIPYRTTEAVPTVDLIARLAAQSSRLLRLEAQQSTACQNSCVLELMKRHKLIAE